MSVKPPPKKKDGATDGAFDLEQQFILRMPQVLLFINVVDGSIVAK